jgi:hypothetical protein
MPAPTPATSRPSAPRRPSSCLASTTGVRRLDPELHRPGRTLGLTVVEAVTQNGARRAGPSSAAASRWLVAPAGGRPPRGRPRLAGATTNETHPRRARPRQLDADAVDHDIPRLQARNLGRPRCSTARPSSSRSPASRPLALRPRPRSRSCASLPRAALPGGRGRSGSPARRHRRQGRGRVSRRKIRDRIAELTRPLAGLAEGAAHAARAGGT